MTSLSLYVCHILMSIVVWIVTSIRRTKTTLVESTGKSIARRRHYSRAGWTPVEICSTWFLMHTVFLAWIFRMLKNVRERRKSKERNREGWSIGGNINYTVIRQFFERVDTMDIINSGFQKSHINWQFHCLDTRLESNFSRNKLFTYVRLLVREKRHK